MAVQHGYGKIAGVNALVFAYDTGDTRNSYKGEPTTNLVSNPIVGDYGNSPGSTTNIISPDGTNNATVPIPNANADRYQQTIAGSLYSSGTQFTYSWHYKQLGTHAGSNQPGGLIVTGLVNCSLVGSVTKIQDLSNGWSRWKATFQITDGSLQSIFRLYFGSVIGINGSSAAYYGHQFEQKSYPTPFINGTRSATQGLLDLTGRSTVDLTNVSFDSNAQPAWDGTGDYIRGSIDPTLLQGAYTIEAVFKHTGTSQWEAIWSNNATSTNWSNSVTLAPILTFDGNSYPSTQYRIGHNAVGVSGTGVFLDLTSAHMNRYVHVCLTRSGTTIKIYANWEGTSLSTTGEYTAYAINPKDNYIIGRHWYNSGGANQTFNGEIPVVKIYNRALTAAEVQSNYRHYKTRFNI